MSTPLECIEKDEREQSRLEETQCKGQAYFADAIVGVNAVR